MLLIYRNEKYFDFETEKPIKVFLTHTHTHTHIEERVWKFDKGFAKTLLNNTCSYNKVTALSRNYFCVADAKRLNKWRLLTYGMYYSGLVISCCEYGHESGHHKQQENIWPDERLSAFNMLELFTIPLHRYS
jgi:hypothetical protein